MSNRNLVILHNHLDPSLIKNLKKKYQKNDILSIKMGMFSSGAEYIKFSLSDVKLIENSNITIIQSIKKPCASNLLHAKLIANTAKKLKAKSVRAIFTYQEYMRQDKNERNFDTISSVTNSLVAKEIVDSGVDEVKIVVPHSNASILDYQQIFKKKFSYVKFADIFANYIKNLAMKENIVIGAPDSMFKENDQGCVRVMETANIIFSNKLKDKIFTMHKERADFLMPKITKFKGQVHGKTAVIIDDIIDTGKTILEAAILLKKQGALKVYAIAAHGVLSKNIEKLLNVQNELSEFYIDKIIISNSLKVEKKSQKYLINNDRFEIIDISNFILN